MRDFSWKVFTVTGDIESYLLYKEHSQLSLNDGNLETAAALENEEEEVTLS